MQDTQRERQPDSLTNLPAKSAGRKSSLCSPKVEETDYITNICTGLVERSLSFGNNYKTGKYADTTGVRPGAGGAAVSVKPRAAAACREGLSVSGCADTRLGIVNIDTKEYYD